MTENTTRDPERYRRVVRALLRELGPVSQGALYQRHTRMPRRALRDALHALREDGEAVCERIPHPSGTLEARWTLL